MENFIRLYKITDKIYLRTNLSEYHFQIIEAGKKYIDNVVINGEEDDENTGGFFDLANFILSRDLGEFEFEFIKKGVNTATIVEEICRDLKIYFIKLI